VTTETTTSSIFIILILVTIITMLVIIMITIIITVTITLTIAAAITISITAKTTTTLLCLQDMWNCICTCYVLREAGCMQAGDHIQSSETAPQDSTPSNSYSSSTSESSARWDAKKRAVKVTPPPPHPCVFSLFGMFCRSWYMKKRTKQTKKGLQTALI